MLDNRQDLVYRHSLNNNTQWEELQKLIVYPPIRRPSENERRKYSENNILKTLDL